MRSRRSHLTYDLGTLAMGVALFLAGSADVFANDPLDPAMQPHLKSWSNIIPTAERFVVLADFNDEAVLDRETGLVWEKSPATDLPDWRGAAQICVGKNVGGRRGWRLPSIPELASLVDPTVASPGPTLPMAHPFTNVQTSQQKGYWTATTMAVLPGNDAWIAWEVFFYNGVVSGNAKMLTDYAWCVHGPMNADTY